jgi:hypothetical protein
MGDSGDSDISYSSWLESIFKPGFMSTLRKGVPGGILRVTLHESASVKRVIELRSIYPFMTLYDIKLAIYNELGKPDSAIPEYAFVCYGTTPLDFQWVLPGSVKPEPFRARPIFKVATGEAPMYSDFVDSTGERKLVGLVQRDRILLEDLFAGKEIPTLDIYLLKDIVAAVPGEKPMNEQMWNGRIYPYFPYLSVNQVVPTEKQKKNASIFLNAFLARRNFYDRVEISLSNEGRMVQPTIDKVRSLRIVWSKEQKIDGTESIFYTLPVTEKRPYMRFIPVEGTALNKVHLLENGTPDIYDHKLLVQWAKQKNPTKNTSDYNDYIFSKFKYRHSEGVQPALYGSLRLFERGTADVIVEPPQGFDELMTEDHLNELPSVLDEIIGDISHLKDKVPTLGPSDFEFTIEVDRGRRTITTGTFDTIFSPFAAFFQEIPAVPGTKPLATLRYKAVSNYVNEKRIFTYLTQLISRKYSRGEADENDLWQAVAEEFQLSEEDARTKVRDRLRVQGEVDMVDPEQNLFGPKYNPGIDISILAKHPAYIVSVYRVQSIEALQRIVVLMSLMFSVNPDEIGVSRKVRDHFTKTQAVAYEAAASAEAEAGVENDLAEAEAEAEKEEVAPAVTTATAATAATAATTATVATTVPAVATVENTNERAAELEGAIDAMGALGSFEDEMNVPTATPKGAAGPAAVPVAIPDDDDREIGFIGSFEEEDMDEAPSNIIPAPIPEELAAQPEAAQTAPLNPSRAAQYRQEFAAEEKRAKESVIISDKPEQITEEKDIPPVTKKSIANYFINKLHEADRRLFDYNKTYKDAPKYVSQCQPTCGRQPAVMTEKRFYMMKDEYARDNVVFIIYPLNSLSEIGDLTDLEVYYVLRYGSSKQKQNYYICSKYFCVYDEIMIREADLLSTKMRKPRLTADGKPVMGEDGSLVYRDKLAGECPFCRGKVIRDKNNPGPDERIIERAVKPQTGRLHSYPYPLKKPNPEGWYLPCCFGDEDTQKALYSSPAFDRYRAEGIPFKSERLESGATRVVPEIPKAPQLTATGKKIQTYAYTLLDVVKKDTSIVGQEKMPLDFSVAEKGVVKPQIGFLPKELNQYFNQSLVDLQSSASHQTRLKEGASGFLRIAVDNALPRADSFLSAVAPFYTNYGINTAADLKARIMENMNIKIFLTMNYGNLAIEFFNARHSLEHKNPRSVDPTPEDLERGEWDSQLGIDEITEDNYQAVLRAVQSYSAFTEWLQRTDTKKEYRQLAHLFAQPNFLRKDPSATKTGGLINRGITFIVVDIHETGTIDIRCPPYGYNMELYAKNDIGFLMHHWTGVWEPIFHANSRTDRRETSNVYDLLFNPEYQEGWPSVIVDRVREFQGKCSGPGRAIYTSMRGINANTLIPLSLIRNVKTKDIKLDGIVRDAYNHVAAVVFEMNGGSIVVPISDDGSHAMDLRFYMDWTDITPAAVDKVVDFYTTILLPKFPMYPKYEPVRYRVVDDSIKYIRLQNALLIPVEKGSSEEADIKVRSSLQAETVQKGEDITEWEINKSIVFDNEDADKDVLKDYQIKKMEFDEIFEHLRLTFSHHVRAQEHGGVLRKRLESVIFTRHLPLFEKRKRLQILLQGEVAEWLTTDKPSNSITRSPLLRVDCTLLEEGECNGRCSWRQSDSQCLLHIPKTVAMDPIQPGSAQRTVDAFQVLLRRLIEELLRFGERRRQMFDGDVRKLVPITEPIKDGQQMIYPENSAAWYDLKETDWVKKGDERPMFLEEMGREGTEEDAVPLTPETRLSESLISALGKDDPRVSLLRVLRIPLGAFFSVLGLPARGIFDAATTFSGPIFTKEELQKISDASLRPIIQIDLREESASELISVPTKKQKTLFAGIPIIVALEDGATALVLPNPEQPRFPGLAELPSALVNKIVAALR